MTAEIIAIEPKFLFRPITNCNVQYLSNQLLQLGIRISSLTVIEDNPIQIKACLLIALDRSDIIIIIGDLKLMSDPFIENSVLITQQSFRENITFFKNKNTITSGFLLKIQDKCIIGLPESSSDLVAMYETAVIPLLNKQSTTNLFSLAIRTFNISEAEIQLLLHDLIVEQTNPIISTFSETYCVTIYLTVICEKNVDPDLLCNPLKNEIEKRVGKFIYGFNNDTIESVVGNKLLKKNVKIAIAESCTGGLIISRLINISGISNILMEGLVTYSNQSKILRLHVKPETLQRYGAVSEETAKEMAIGLLHNYGIDMALSVTGIAGPNGGSVDKPVGLVYICIASKKSVSIYKHQFSGDRENIREMSCMSALDHIRLFITE